jgi:hypothetical protein
MPLHDWKDDRGWDSVHPLWLAELLYWMQDHLPAGYRAYLGAVPALTVGTANGRPDVLVRRWDPETAGSKATETAVIEPDLEAAITVELDPQRAVHIDLHGVLIAAIEVTSPRNKDRPDSRETYSRRYLGYIRQGVHLLLIDVLPHPAKFSFADAIAADLKLKQPETQPPFAVSYRVGEPIPGGTFMAYWRRACQVGQPLPVIPLALNVHQAVNIDLEHTYHQAAKRAYLD